MLFRSRFATSVNNTARNVETAAIAHEEAIKEATTNLSHVTTRTSAEIPVIDAKLATVKANNTHVRETEEKLALLTQPPSQKPEHPTSA